MPRLLARYTAYTTRLMDQGVTLQHFKCPHDDCAKEILHQRPPRGATWDSTGQCPHCEKYYWRVSRYNKVTVKPINVE